MTYVKTFQRQDIIMFDSGGRLGYGGPLSRYEHTSKLHVAGRPVRRLLIFDVWNNSNYLSRTFVWCAELLDKLVCGDRPDSGSVGDGYEITSADSKSSNKLGRREASPTAHNMYRYVIIIVVLSVLISRLCSASQVPILYTPVTIETKIRDVSH